MSVLRTVGYWLLAALLLLLVIGVPLLNMGLFIADEVESESWFFAAAMFGMSLFFVYLIHDAWFHNESQQEQASYAEQLSGEQSPPAGTQPVLVPVPVRDGEARSSETGYDWNW
jgi:hypothetical protein